MLRVQSGVTDCYDVLVERYKVRLFNYLYRLTGSRDEAEERIGDRRRVGQHQRRLAKVVERQARQSHAHPGGLDRATAEMA